MWAGDAGIIALTADTSPAMRFGAVQRLVGGMQHCGAWARPICKSGEANRSTNPKLLSIEFNGT